VNTAHDAQAVPPPQAAHDGPTCPISDAAAPARLLAPWVRNRCPHLDGERCRLPSGRGGGCALLGDTVRPCSWAEHGPILCAPEAVFRAYLAAVPNPVWRRSRRAAWVGAAVGSVLTPAPCRAGRPCPSCGKGQLAPRRRVCDACRVARRRATWRDSKRQRRGA
jgi:hypothetical protein